MNRRNFLASLLATAVLDPERLLWVPGAKTISIPAPRVIEVYHFQPWGHVVEVTCFGDAHIRYEHKWWEDMLHGPK